VDGDIFVRLAKHFFRELFVLKKIIVLLHIFVLTLSSINMIAMNKRILAIPLCLAGIQMYAQVEFVDPNSIITPVDASRQWAHMDVFRPYDSVDFVVPVWPTIEAYKKYVGQTFFLLAQKQSRNSYLLNNMSPKSKSMTSKEVVLLSAPIKKGKYPAYKKGKLADIVNKYYNIVNVINYMDDATGKPKMSLSTMKQTGNRVYEYPCKDEENRTCTSPAEVPCFVLVEQMTGDTCYTVFPEKFLLVGAYVKIQKQFQDARLNYVIRKVAKNDKERWRVVKVAVATRDFYDYPDYEGMPTISFIIQNSKGIQKAIPVKEYVNMKWWSTDDPQLVNDALAKKRAAEEESKCCNDLVQELDTKYSATKEMQQSVRPTISSPVVTQDIERNVQTRPKTTPRSRERRPKTSN
jgi:hypothetical protein